MKIVTCVGYTCSGSSAVTNMLMEFENFCKLTPRNECRLLQDPDGIADLEYNLFDNRHRLNSEFAIKRYEIYTNKIDIRNFKQIFGNEWKKLNNEYINSLIQVRYSSYWHADLRNLNLINKVKYYTHRGCRIILSKFTKLNRENNKNYFPKLQMYLPIDSREKFLENTQLFCKKIFDSLNKENKEYGIVDQLVPPRNIERYLRYVQNLKVIVVDRDPRDVYMESILKNDRAFPKDVKKFCKIYRDNRLGENHNENILEIKFEDMIYNHKITYKKILKFIGENEKFHINKGKYFSIENSKNNTQIWKKHPEYLEQIKYIERELNEYLYSFND